MIFLIELSHLGFVLFVHGGCHLVIRVFSVEILLGDSEFFCQSIDFRVCLVLPSFQFAHGAFELVLLSSSEKVQLLFIRA